MKTAFLSYCWANEKFADIIDSTFQALGIIVKRDKREVGYKDNLKHYMQSIRDCDYAILLISDESLKSQACMYEVCEIMKERDYLQKILPVILPETKIYNVEQQLEYVKYWMV